MGTSITLNEREGGAFVELRLCAPPRNVLDGDALDAIADAALSVRAQHPRARAVLLSAEGPNFSVGASVPEHDRAHAPRMLARFHGAVRALLDVELPIVAAVRGHCLGGGLEFALLSSRIVSAPVASFGQPEIRLAAIAPVASLLLPGRIGQARAEALLLSGDLLSASAAHAQGLVDELSEEPEAAAAAWIRASLAAHSPSAMRLATRAARAVLRRDLDALLPRLEHLYIEELLATHDAEEGVRAFIEKRAPRWEAP